jgi:type II secretory pathway pseudopilin PulG
MISNYKKGITLIETLVMIGVFTLAMGAIGSLILSIYRSYNYNFQQAAAITEARKGIETMVKEIREARTAEDGSYPLVQAGDLEFVFYGDINGDGATERVRYFLNSTDFKKGIIKPSGDPPQYVLANETIDVISRYVHNGMAPVFTYYNGDWPTDTINNPLPTLTRLSDTKLMHVYLKINVDPSRPPDDFDLESDTQIRNLKTNL